MKSRNVGSSDICCVRPSKAGDRIRTGDIQLGKLSLYQLSYARKDYGIQSTATTFGRKHVV